MSLPDDILTRMTAEGFDPGDLAGVTIDMVDIRAAGYCGPGLREWMQAYGFDIRAFVVEGLPAQTMMETGDAHAVRVVLAKLKAVRDGA